MNTVQVEFEKNGKLYTYATDIDLAVGDIAVVCTPTNGYVTVKVRKVGTSVPTQKWKWIVQKVDVEAYEARIAREVRREEIKQTLKQIVSEEEELLMLRRVAENNPKAASLIKELDALLS